MVAAPRVMVAGLDEALSENASPTPDDGPESARRYRQDQQGIQRAPSCGGACDGPRLYSATSPGIAEEGLGALQPL